MRVLHTSDWHIGRSLYGRRRYGEMQAFLSWFEGVIRERGVEALLIAGDVFDNTTPSNQAQELYYHFLQHLVDSPCRHVVITAGNHDSPTFLDAPRALLRLLNIHVVGQAALEDEALLLRNEDGEPELIVCAVPYLHDRDVRAMEADEGIQDRQKALVRGIASHYTAVLGRARELQAQAREAGVRVPAILMGHLFATSGVPVTAGDGVRELYVGAQVQLRLGELLPPDISDIGYVALGHLHVPQRVGENARYSGSPIPMGFGEAGQQKSVCLVDIAEDAKASVELIPVPVFQRLERVRGSWEDIERRLAELRLSGPHGGLSASGTVWLEVVYEGEGDGGDIPGLQERLDRCLEDCPDLELLCVRDEARVRRVLKGRGGGLRSGAAALDELSPLDVFERRLESVAEVRREDLRLTYREALAALSEAGTEEA